MSKTQYTYEATGKTDYPFKCNIGGYIFPDEQRAANFCQMWNDHWAALEQLDDIPHILTRQEYEAACAALDIPIMSDAECDSYGVRYGQFTPWLDEAGNIAGYTPEQAIQMALAGRRLLGIKAERKTTPQQTLRPDYPDGRLLDCGCTVYWRHEVMSASLGSSCPDCYDQMSN